MGQAKRRGSREERTQQSIKKTEELLPEFLTCNSCSTKVYDLNLLPTEGISGIEVACAGICPDCGDSTWGINGDPEATQQLMEILSEELNQSDPKIGIDQFKL